MDVVDGKLTVSGVESLRVAVASILPRLTTGNTMAPCIVIGEQAVALLQRKDDDSRDRLMGHTDHMDENAESLLEAKHLYAARTSEAAFHARFSGHRR